MAVKAPQELNVDQLVAEVTAMYARVAKEPDGEFHFHRGPAYAAELLGYDAEELAQLPAEATASFAGIANPLAIDALEAGETVLDVGSGAGMDLLLAAGRVGPGGKAIGVDMTPRMIERSRAAAATAGYAHVEVREGSALDLPAEDGEADVVISNGVINLTPDKERAFTEIYRVLKPGGRLLLGDIVVQDELSPGIRSNIELWTG
jgi:arsenite methyltransferase